MKHLDGKIREAWEWYGDGVGGVVGEASNLLELKSIMFHPTLQLSNLKVFFKSICFILREMLPVLKSEFSTLVNVNLTSKWKVTSKKIVGWIQHVPLSLLLKNSYRIIKHRSTVLNYLKVNYFKCGRGTLSIHFKTLVFQHFYFRNELL